MLYPENGDVYQKFANTVREYTIQFDKSFHKIISKLFVEPFKRYGEKV